MRITCPNCQFKGLIDSAPLAFQTPVACVRCGTTFEAVMVEGEIQTSMLPDDYESFLAPLPAPESDFESIHSASDMEDVLALPQNTEASYQTGEEPAPVLEDVLMVSTADADPTMQESLPANETEGAAEEPQALTEASSARLSDEPQSAKTEETEADASFDFDQTQIETAAAADRHNVGMRLMRISPLWLLVCGVTFISVIILSNQFAKPAEPEQRVATNFGSPSNKATNQTLSQPSTPAATNPTATSVKDDSQMAAPAPVEVKKEEQATQAKAETKAQDEQKPAPVVAAEAETKTSAPVVATAPQVQSGSSGGFTIQIGSYNVIEQANERVARLQSAGFDARVVAVELPKRGTWYRVQAGRFSSREEAARYGADMKARGAADNFIIAETQSGR